MLHNQLFSGKHTEMQDAKPIKFKYVKTNTYRTFHADGFIGGISISGNLQLDFFVEKYHLPDEHSYDPANPSFEIKTKDEPSKREIEGGVVMDYATMKSLKVWLDERIRFFEDNFIQSKTDIK